MQAQIGACPNRGRTVLSVAQIGRLLIGRTIRACLLQTLSKDCSGEMRVAGREAALPHAATMERSTALAALAAVEVRRMRDFNMERNSRHIKG
jgi:hypothetical protein